MRTSSKGKTHEKKKKKNWERKFGPKSVLKLDLNSKIFFCHFLKFGLLVFV